jgi:hypothetical protein
VLRAANWQLASLTFLKKSNHVQYKLCYVIRISDDFGLHHTFSTPEPAKCHRAWRFVNSSQLIGGRISGKHPY